MRQIISKKVRMYLKVQHMKHPLRQQYAHQKSDLSSFYVVLMGREGFFDFLAFLNGLNGAMEVQSENFKPLQFQILARITL